jgi:hypothetical protein
MATRSDLLGLREVVLLFILFDDRGSSFCFRDRRSGLTSCTDAKSRDIEGREFSAKLPQHESRRLVKCDAKSHCLDGWIKDGWMCQEDSGDVIIPDGSAKLGQAQS